LWGKKLGFLPGLEKVYELYKDKMMLVVQAGLMVDLS
jgi:hypothetical protein